MMQVNNRNLSLFINLSYGILISILFCNLAFSNEGEYHDIGNGIRINEKLRSETLIPKSLTEKIEDNSFLIDNYTKTMTKEYLEMKGNQMPFLGFYLRFDSEKDLEFYDYEYDLKLQWSLFRDGLYESKKTLKKEKLQNELQILQLNNNIKDFRLNGSLDDISNISEYISSLNFFELADTLEEIIKRRSAQLKDGYITKDDLEQTKFQYNQALLNKGLYNLESPAIIDLLEPPAIIDLQSFNILNRIEFCKLINLDSLLKQTRETSIDLKIQENLIKRAELAKSWADDLTADLYIQHRRDQADDTENNIGIQLEIPIHYYKGRGKIIRKEQELYRHQMSIVEVRSKKQLKKLSKMFYFQQRKILVKLLEYEKISNNIITATERAKDMSDVLDYTPERAIDLMLTEKINVKYEIMGLRIKIYEIIAKIVSAAGLENFKDAVILH